MIETEKWVDVYHDLMDYFGIPLTGVSVNFEMLDAYYRIKEVLREEAKKMAKMEVETE